MEGKPIPLNVELQNVKAAREIVRAAAFRTASVFGIPADWLSYEVVTIADDDNAYFQLQVSLRVWDEQLWAQSGAFEQQVLKRIREDDRNVARAVRAVLWRILPDAGCPHDELSSSQAWWPETVSSRALAYDRLRASLSPRKTDAPLSPAPRAPGFESMEVAAPITGFIETMPVNNPSFGASEFPASGFPATRPVSLSEELPPIQTGKV